MCAQILPQFGRLRLHGISPRQLSQLTGQRSIVVLLRNDPEITRRTVERAGPSRPAVTRNRRQRRHHQHDCVFCGKIFPFPAALEAHMRTHTKERPFNCPTCDNSFPNLSSLYPHIMAMHSNRPKKYICQFCGKKCSSQTGINDHLKRHIGEKPFGCSLCDKTFVSRREVEMHQRTHTGNKPFRCYICRKFFGRKSTLEGHMRLHTGEKPFKCDNCGKSFRSNSARLYHFYKTGHGTL